MPIYAYRCETCGHAKDVLQKISDPVLSTCPACGAQTFVKQVTAAGFQLKGSGWYVTDFRGGEAGKKKAEGGDAEPAAPGKPEQADQADKKADKASIDDAKPKEAAGKAAVDKPAPAAAPAPASSSAPAASPTAAPPPAKA